MSKVVASIKPFMLPGSAGRGAKSLPGIDFFHPSVIVIASKIAKVRGLNHLKYRMRIKFLALKSFQFFQITSK
jgi:hypothetical protein